MHVCVNIGSFNTSKTKETYVAVYLVLFTESMEFKVRHHLHILENVVDVGIGMSGFLLKYTK